MTSDSGHKGEQGTPQLKETQAQCTSAGRGPPPAARDPPDPSTHPPPVTGPETLQEEGGHSFRPRPLALASVPTMRRGTARPPIGSSCRRSLGHTERTVAAAWHGLSGPPAGSARGPGDCRGPLTSLTLSSPSVPPVRTAAAERPKNNSPYAGTGRGGQRPPPVTQAAASRPLGSPSSGESNGAGHPTSRDGRPALRASTVGDRGNDVHAVEPPPLLSF